MFPFGLRALEISAHPRLNCIISYNLVNCILHSLGFCMISDLVGETLRTKVKIDCDLGLPEVSPWTWPSVQHQKETFMDKTSLILKELSEIVCDSVSRELLLEFWCALIPHPPAMIALRPITHICSSFSLSSLHGLQYLASIALYCPLGQNPRRAAGDRMARNLWKNSDRIEFYSFFYTPFLFLATAFLCASDQPVYKKYNDKVFFLNNEEYIKRTKQFNCFY